MNITRVKHVCKKLTVKYRKAEIFNGNGFTVKFIQFTVLNSKYEPWLCPEIDKGGRVGKD